MHANILINAYHDHVSPLQQGYHQAATIPTNTLMMSLQPYLV